MALPSSFRDIPIGSPVYNLLCKHDTGHGSFITHLDRMPIPMKAGIFLIPFTFNAIMAILIAWRARSASTHYDILAILFAGELMPKYKPGPPSSWFWFCMNIIIDYCVYQFMLPVVKNRASLNKLPPDEFQLAYTQSIFQAINPNFLQTNVGYNTRIGFWSVEYEAPMSAYQLVEDGVVDLDYWDVSVYQRDSTGWKVWEVVKSNGADGSGWNRTMQIFMGKLEAMDKSDLAEKFKAMLQTYTNLPDRILTPEGIRPVEELFKNENLDFVVLWNEGLREASSVADA
ncbi:uncharacterized protein EV420DRAFT_1684629 [Desarmillaria tabescens]|uniref:Uncharacterized protein n=1 Tax=Armillaria tabescens TaxID=1929756 RepID=A0AA39T6I7_ARMTA|nr:uncharacterized protein EV420DRAFT_1684629 [Desarmillaria tabescens]KAK0467891.1 hypothetical protein EV420DRAFT_1684629 [Desarmillaria tabescens]